MKSHNSNLESLSTSQSEKLAYSDKNQESGLAKLEARNNQMEKTIKNQKNCVKLMVMEVS